jgi:hypothetical protein
MTVLVMPPAGRVLKRLVATAHGVSDFPIGEVRADRNCVSTRGPAGQRTVTRELVDRQCPGKSKKDREVRSRRVGIFRGVVEPPKRERFRPPRVGYRLI